MTSSWDSPGPKRNLVNTHFYVGCLYAFLTIVVLIVLLIGLSKADFDLTDFWSVAFCSVMAFCHFRVSAAAERDKQWVKASSIGLSLFLLPAFPIGTFFGVKILLNAARLQRE